jgi:hypothetical protein
MAAKPAQLAAVARGRSEEENVMLGIVGERWVAMKGKGGDNVQREGDFHSMAS